MLTFFWDTFDFNHEGFVPACLYFWGTLCLEKQTQIQLISAHRLECDALCMQYVQLSIYTLFLSVRKHSAGSQAVTIFLFLAGFVLNTSIAGCIQESIACPSYLHHFWPDLLLLNRQPCATFHGHTCISPVVYLKTEWRRKRC